MSVDFYQEPPIDRVCWGCGNPYQAGHVCSQELLEMCLCGHDKRRHPLKDRLFRPCEHSGGLCNCKEFREASK